LIQAFNLKLIEVIDVNHDQDQDSLYLNYQLMAAQH